MFSSICSHSPLVFGEISPLIGQMIQKDQPAALRQFALCVFDDLVEHTQERSLPFWDAFIPFMLDYATDPHPGVRYGGSLLTE